MNMKVWLINYDGDVSVWSRDTDVTKIPFVETELSYLDGGYEEEREGFLDDLKRAIDRGRGTASIEERFWVELVEIGTL